MNKQLREREQFKAIITEYFGGEFDENYTVSKSAILDLMQKAHDMDKWVPVRERSEPPPPDRRELPPLIQKLADAIGAKGLKITFGLQPSDIKLIEATIKEGFTMEYAFEKAAKQINWDKYTLACWYIKYLLKTSTQNSK